MSKLEDVQPNAVRGILPDALVTVVCHLWNLVAAETREGDVYHALAAMSRDRLEDRRYRLAVGFPGQFG